MEIGIWRVDGQARRLTSTSMPLEKHLESLIDSDPTVLGSQVMIVGRQVPTKFGTFIDLLGVDADGVVHVFELKRGRTPRDVVAQTLDYGSWVQTLGNEEIRAIFAGYRKDAVFDEEFAKVFGAAPPDEINEEHRLTVIASELDPATERIVAYLHDRGVPVNAVFFRYYEDDGRSYLARTWLIEENRQMPAAAASRGPRTKEPWNGVDWYISFGDEPQIRDWDDARQYGFVSAGGGAWYSRTLRTVPVGARVWAYIPKTGYVGVGEVVGEAVRAEDAMLTVDGEDRMMSELPLRAQYRHAGLVDDMDAAEYVLPVRWIKTVGRGDAFLKSSLFANQNSACKLRHKSTLEELVRFFDVDV